MDTKAQNYKEKWAAVKDKYAARANRLEAAERIHFDRAFDDFEAQVAAAGDWTEAAWDEFTATVDARFQALVISQQD